MCALRLYKGLKVYEFEEKKLSKVVRNSQIQLFFYSEFTHRQKKLISLKSGTIFRESHLLYKLPATKYSYTIQLCAIKTGKFMYT